MIRVRRININSFIDKNFIKSLIKTKTHYRNMLILLSESSSLSNDSKYLVRDYKKFAYLIRNTYHDKNDKIKNTCINFLNEIENDTSLKSIFKNILALYDVYTSKFLLEVNKELGISYKTAFINIKNNNIESFSMKTKRVSSINHGMINFDSNITTYKKGVLFLNLFSTKYSKNNKLVIHIHDKFLENNTLKNCQIVWNGIDYELLITYDNGKEEYLLDDSGNYLSIDVGTNNHLSLYDNRNDKSYIIRNRAINRVNNRLFNLISNIQSKLDLLKNKNDYGNHYKRLKIKKLYLYNERHKIIRNEIHKITSKLIKYCQANEINTIVYGFNKFMKNGINIGKTNNKKLYSIPHEMILNQLVYKGKEYGIAIVKQEESYTSKLSCLNDLVWLFEYGEKNANESNGIRGITMRGKKITSLFKDKVLNKIFHSDINGSVNILQKYLQRYVNPSINTLCSPIILKDEFMIERIMFS